MLRTVLVSGVLISFAGLALTDVLAGDARVGLASLLLGIANGLLLLN